MFLVIPFCFPPFPMFTLPSSPLLSILFPYDTSSAASFWGRISPPLPPSTTFGYWVRDRETGMNTLLEVSELTQTTLWKSSLVIQIKNHKMSLPFDQYFHSRKLFKIWGKPYVWRFFNALLFIIGKTKEEKLLKYPKIAKCLSKFWSIHMVEKYTHTKQTNIQQ